VKAWRGKTAHHVWAADGGQREGNLMRHLRPDTDEGGEPPGSRKGRPRYPPEGRGKRAYESVERKHNETQNSNFMCTDIDRIAELASSPGLKSGFGFRSA
jgi:hypothetical protein